MHRHSGILVRSIGKPEYRGKWRRDQIVLEEVATGVGGNPVAHSGPNRDVLAAYIVLSNPPSSENTSLIVLACDKPGNHVIHLANSLRERRNGQIQEQALLLLSNGRAVVWLGDSTEYEKWVADVIDGVGDPFPLGMKSVCCAALCNVYRETTVAGPRSLYTGGSSEKRLARSNMIPRFRYTLRLVLLFMAFIAVVLAHFVWQARIEHEARSAIKAADGLVRDDYFYRGRTTIPKIILNSIGHEYFFRTLEVAAPFRKLSDTDLAKLGRLSRLKGIATNRAWMGSQIGTLSILNAGNDFGPPLITDDGLQHLSRVRSLEFLILFSPQITDAAIPHLCRLRSLERFWTSGTSITEVGAMKLKRALPDCEVITGDE